MVIEDEYLHCFMYLHSPTNRLGNTTLVKLTVSAGMNKTENKDYHLTFNIAAYIIFDSLDFISVNEGNQRDIVLRWSK